MDARPLKTPTPGPCWTHAALLAAVAAATAFGLPLVVDGKPDESAFVHLYEATSLLAGDHPYRDFFEWGAPLPALLSAGVQWLVGYRLIGELVLQWSLTVAGVVIAVHLGVRQAGTRLPVLAAVPFILLVAPRAGYHFSKLFCIPAALWLAARYLDTPSLGRSAAMGVFTAVAFLFRHDYAIWAGLSSVLGLGLARLVDPGIRSLRGLCQHAGAYAIAVLATLLPWLVLVSSGEGLLSYTAATVERFGLERGAGTEHPYGAILPINPLTQLRRAPVPVPVPENGVANPENGSADGVVRWLAQVSMLVPLALVASGAAGLYRRRFENAAARSADAERLISGVVLAGVCEVLFREWSYFLIVAPLTAALGSQFLRPGRAGHVVRRTLVPAVAAAGLLLTTYAAALWRPPAWTKPITGTLASVRAAARVWMTPRYEDKNRVHAFLRTCSREDDRLLVVGSTPYHVPYYTHRAIAGGHLDWSFGLRGGPALEAASLRLLQRQSVPFVVGRRSHVLAEFDRYPSIRAYLAANFAELDGSGGTLLYDTRRAPVRAFGPAGWPCFK